MKKGQIQVIATTGMFVVLAIVVLLILIFGWGILTKIFANLLALAGATVILLGLLKASKSKKPLNFILVTGTIGLILITLNYSGFVQQSIVTGNENVYVLNYGHLICREQDSISTLIDHKYFNQFSVKQDGFFGSPYIVIPCDEFVNACQFDINKDRVSGNLLDDSIFTTEICPNYQGTGCGTLESYTSKKPSDIKTVTVPFGKSIKISMKGVNPQVATTVITKSAKLFSLRGQENGQLFDASKDCVLSSDLQDQVGVNEPNRIEKDGYINYVINSVLVSTKTYTYQNQKAICLARSLYKVDTESFKDGSSTKVQGSKLTNVECCPSEPNCDSTTFKFKPNIVRQCSISAECINGGNPIAKDGTHYTQFSCSSEGQCVESSPIQVQCTNNNACGNDKICDLTLNNYGKCIDAPVDNNYCGNGVCDSVSGETSGTCSIDCLTSDSKQECLDKADKFPYFGYEYKEVQTTKGKGPFGILGIFGLNETVTTGFCEATLVPYYIIGGIVLVLGTIYIQTNKRKRKR